MTAEDPERALSPSPGSSSLGGTQRQRDGNPDAVTDREIVERLRYNWKNKIKLKGCRRALKTNNDLCDRPQGRRDTMTTAVEPSSVADWGSVESSQTHTWTGLNKRINRFMDVV